MPMIFSKSVLIASMLLLLGPSASSSQSRPLLIELWVGGDDGLTQKLFVSMEETFKHSSVFTVSDGKKPAELIVCLCPNVDWKKVGMRTQVLYKVDFSTGDKKPLGKSVGKCWEDHLSECSAKILADATAAARQLRQ